MSAKEQAIQDIKDELRRQGKCFIAFHTELNPAIGRLVMQQIKRQAEASFPFRTPRHKSILVARCFFCDGQIQYSNYSKYYEGK